MEDNGASSYHRFLEGDDNGIVDIVNRYKDGLILYLNQYVSDIHLAEDLAEDTFFKLMVKKPRYTNKYTFQAWLYAIGRNLTIDYIRRRTKLFSPSDDDLELLLAEKETLEKSYIKIPLVGSSSDIFRTNTFCIFGKYVWSPYLLLVVPILIGVLCMPFAARGWSKRLRT